MYFAYLFFQFKTHRNLFQNKFQLDRDEDDLEDEDEDEENIKQQDESSDYETKWHVYVWLLFTIVTALNMFCMVVAIDKFAEEYSTPKIFLSLILLPLANSDDTSAVRMAMKGQMAKTVDICIGTAIQSIAFVEPLLVIIGWCSGHEITLRVLYLETLR
ncbi:hypothetical protein EV361DRAFT_942228 [Lentinula raphanica]|nr:hypothetical protein EV361DRAFT_942228 [Lentinula raphanica]